MDECIRRNFYRKCKEDIEWYLASNDKKDYACLYRLLGNPAGNKFVNFEGCMAEDLLKYLKIYFANKMRGGCCNPLPPISLPELLIALKQAFMSPATTEQAGIVRLSTEEEVSQLTSKNSVITAYDLGVAIRKLTGTFIHYQNTPSSEWLIVHNLDKFPSVSVVDDNNKEVGIDVEYIDNNTCRVLLNTPETGMAYLN